MAENSRITVKAEDSIVELPLLDGSVGPKVIDIRKLYAETGHFTYDPGFVATASCESKITYIDGDEGVLMYRGYAIDELAEHSDFMEVCYLLLYGELPTREQKDKFVHDVTYHSMIHEAIGAALPRLPPRCASHGDPGGRGGCAFRLLSRQP